MTETTADQTATIVPETDPNALPTFDIGATMPIEATVEAKTYREALDIFVAQNDGLVPDTIGTRTVLGLCEGTGKIILDGDIWENGGEGVMLLKETVDGLGEADVVFEDEEEDEDGDDD